MEELGLPTGFGKATEKHDFTAQIAQTKRKDASTSNGSAVAPTDSAALPTTDANGDAQDDADDLPISHQVILAGHTKAVSALSVDPSGTRVASGGYDYDVKLWDFGGMTSTFRPFRSFEAKEGHQVKDLSWSTTGDSFLCLNGSNQPQLFDRDGQQIAEFIKGDMYLRDMHHCAGHIAEVTSTAWHPKDPSTFLTASADSTLRIWSVDDKRKSKTVIVVKSKQPGSRTRVTACAYSPDGKTIAAACQDGAVHTWSTSSNFARPSSTVEKAHLKDTATSGIAFSHDGKSLVTRGGDDCVKMWNPKALKKPTAVREGLVSNNPETNIVFSPDDRFVLTGLAADKSSGTEGRVVVLTRDTLDIARSISISPSNVIRVLWHPRINQILTGSSSGEVHVLYSPSRSTKGATLSLSRLPRQRRADDDGVDVSQQIFTPHALPLFKDDDGAMGGRGRGDGEVDVVVGGGTGKKRKLEKERNDPQKSMKPLPPLTGPGRGGRVGASATQHVVQGLVKDSIRHEDPREALLKFAQEHEGEAPKWTAAWQGNKVVMDERLLEEEGRQEEEKKRKEEERKRMKRERPPPLHGV